MKQFSLFSALALFIVFASSCNRDREAKALITVVQDEVDIVTGDTVQETVAQASVRFYSNKTGAEDLETVEMTNSNGQAEFIWFEDVIIFCDVSFGPNQSLENVLILNQGETTELEVNLREL